MKLKNKKTGEINEVIVSGYPVSGKTTMFECSVMDTNEEDGYKTLGTYTSLAELNAEWEDPPEEPERKHWYMTSWGEVWQYGDDSIHEKWRIILGNDFETKEEAEKAVEKLKAVKRLKDAGCRVTECKTYGGTTSKGEFIGEVRIILDVPDVVDKELLCLLFGGEE